VHCSADLQSVHGVRCYDDVAPNAKCQRVLVLALCLVPFRLQLTNKAIVDYTSPALSTPVTPFPPIGDAAYRQRAGGGPSHGRRQHAQKFDKDRACGSGDTGQTDKDTHRQTSSSCTILRNRSRGRSNKGIFSSVL